MTAFVKFLDGEENNPKTVSIIFAFSAVFHIVIFIIVPLVFSLTWKPRILSRPPTFELIQIQLPQPPSPAPTRPVEQPARPIETPPAPAVETPPAPVEIPKPIETPKPVVKEPKVEPKPQETQKPKEVSQSKPVETPKPVEEDVSDLESLFSEPSTLAATSAAASVSAITAEPFEYQWYLDQLQSRIRSRWKPAANEKGEVFVQFVISRDGSMSGLKLVTSSGRTILDRQAMQAVGMAAPFASLPSGFSGQSLTVNLTLKPGK